MSGLILGVALYVLMTGERPTEKEIIRIKKWCADNNFILHHIKESFENEFKEEA